MEKTFREVVADIKEGEVWKAGVGWDINTIEMTNGNITFNRNNLDKLFVINKDTRFKLKRKEYSFEEAFKAYEEGKKVESISFKYKKYKETDGFIDEDGYWKDFSKMSFDLSEIRGRWYIND